MVIERGRIVADGDPAEVVATYQRLMMDAPTLPSNSKAPSAPAESHLEQTLGKSAVRFGRGGAAILGVGLYENGRGPVELIEGRGELLVRISFRASETIDHPNVGFLIINEQGVTVTSANLQMYGIFPERIKPGDVRTAEFRLRAPRLERNSYSIHATVADGLGKTALYLDSVQGACVFSVIHEVETYGIVRVPAEAKLV